VVCALQLEALLEPILARLREIMGSPPPRVRTHNLVFVPVGCPAQAWHCDDTVARGVTHRYFTILIHLNPLDALCGGTEVWEPRLKRGDLVIHFTTAILHLFSRTFHEDTGTTR
jgi:hypothetical protein